MNWLSGIHYSIIKRNLNRKNSIFFDAHLLLIVDSLKRNDLKKTSSYFNNIDNSDQLDRFNIAIVESLKEYIIVFKEKKISSNKKNFGTLQ